MALHFKSTTKFKALIGFSALAVSGIAALFSVTGVSSLFKGAWLTIVIMMSILEVAKIVVASYVARFWKDISKTLRTYFIIATIVLMAITSAGIFGYLSEAYQGTKGNYDITEQESGALSAKKKNYEEQIQRYKERVTTLNSFRASQEVRLDSLYSKKMNVSAKRVEEGIKRNDTEIQSLNEKISSLIDSVGNLGTQIISKQSVNVKGELGPLKFVATVFNTDMDTVVKYLIMMLIFVFDPLAVLLFVSLSVMIRKEVEKEKLENETKQEQIPIKDVLVESVKPQQDGYLGSEYLRDAWEIKPQPIEIETSTPEIVVEQPEKKKPVKVSNVKVVKKKEKNKPVKIDDEETPEEKELKEIVETLSEKTAEKKDDSKIELDVEQSQPVEEVPDVVKTKDVVETKNEHEFYYGEVSSSDEPPQIPQSPSAPPVVEWHTANWRGNR